MQPKLQLMAQAGLHIKISVLDYELKIPVGDIAHHSQTLTHILFSPSLESKNANPVKRDTNLKVTIIPYTFRTELSFLEQ
jgi:hypothetical protein